MAYATSRSEFARYEAPAARVTRPGLLRRMADRFLEARQRKADREIAVVLARRVADFNLLEKAAASF